MAIQTAQGRENLAIAYGNSATYASLHTASPGTTGANELSTTGGSPAYARKQVSWSPGSVDGTVTATVVFDVPTGITVAGAGFWTAVTGGTYIDGGTVTSQAFTSQGAYTLTATFTVS